MHIIDSSLVSVLIHSETHLLNLLPYSLVVSGLALLQFLDYSQLVESALKVNCNAYKI